MKLAGVEDFFQYIAEPCAVSDLEIDVRKTISIKLEGDQWNGQFDYQVARFLIELQRSYLDVYNLITNSNKNMKSLKAINDNIVISVSVKPGCTEIVTEVAGAISSIFGAFKDMDSKDKKHTIISVAALLCLVYGGARFLSYLENADDNAARVHALDSMQAVSQCSVESLKQVALESLKPYSTLTTQMRAGDRMTIDGVTYSKADASEAFSGKTSQPKGLGKTFRIDGTYQITNTDFENGSITLARDGRKFSADTRILLEDDKDELHRIYLEADKKQIVPEVDLLVMAEVMNGKIIFAAVDGLGAPRQKTVPLLDALDAKMPDPKPSVKRSSLMDDNG